MKKSKRWIALVLTCAMVFTTLIGSAFAADVADVYTENVPDSITEDMGKGILSGATAAANTTELNILGINVTSTDSAGALNAMSDATAPLDLLVFGSDLNEAPDPYLYNFYYNLAKDEFELPGTQYEINAYAGWKGDYTLLNYAKSGPSGVANTEDTNKPIDISVNGVYMDCNPVFFYEPDVLFGVAEDSYDPGLLDYNDYKASLAAGDDEYKFIEYIPEKIGGWTTNGKALNDGTFKSTYTMANAVYKDAVEIADYLDKNDLDLESRYGDIAQCGIDYSNFALGIFYYVQSRLNPSSSLIGKISKAGYCTGISIAEYGGQITITNAYEDEFNRNTRYLQYLDCIADYVEQDPDVTYGSYGDLAKDVELIIMDTDELTETQLSRLNTVGIKVVDIDSVMPNTVYGTTMQSADNILGVPYFVGLLYEGNFSIFSTSLSEYDYTAYFVKNIYHVKDENVEEVVEEMFSNGSGAANKTLKDRGLTNGYDGYIQSLIEIGAAYYKQSDYYGSGIWAAVDNGDFG